MSTDARLQFLMIVDDPDIAAFVGSNGVDILFVDLERIGKEERQPGLDTVKSVQTVETVQVIRAAVPDTNLLVRLNPLHEGTKREVERAIEAGADRLMLPMFRDYKTLARFFEIVDERAVVVPLFETIGSLAALQEILQHLPLTDAHIGLNDLHIERGDRMMFVPLAEGVLDKPAALLREAGVRFGIGGIARAGEGLVTPELILGEHVRLGSSAAILSRSFHRRAATLETLQAEINFSTEIKKLQTIFHEHASSSEHQLSQNREAFIRRVGEQRGLPFPASLRVCEK